MKNYCFKLATQKAERFVKEQGIAELPVDPLAIAESLDIVVQAKPDTAEGVSGMLLRHGDCYGIAYATHIDNDGFQRFSVGHEIGHLLLEGHIDHLLSKDNSIHVSHAGFVSADRYEREADHFAAGLLMPDPLFSREMIRHGDGLEAIEALADRCCTSLTATAIRYAEKTAALIAVVMSTGDHVEYCFMSKVLQEFDELEWLRNDQSLPAGVETERFNRNQSNVREGRRTTAETNIRDWFGGRRSIEATEEVIGLGRYGKTLTVISAAEFADDDNEDERLEESWRPRFRKLSSMPRKYERSDHGRCASRQANPQACRHLDQGVY